MISVRSRSKQICSEYIADDACQTNTNKTRETSFCGPIKGLKITYFVVLAISDIQTSR